MEQSFQRCYWRDKKRKQIRKRQQPKSCPYGWYNGLGNDQPEDDKRLIVTIHYYNPLPFTHQGASWVKPGYPIGLRWNDTQKERDAVTADFEKIKKFSEDNKNVPIHIGEFGVHFEADIDSRQ